MTVSLVLVSLIAVVLGILLRRERKRRKPYRPSANPPAVPGKRLQKNIGAPRTRKTRARIRKRHYR